MNLHVISTGSKGNCYLLIDDRGRVIALDAGVRANKILEALHFDISTFGGALITHEHMDHALAVKDLLARGCHVFMTAGTSDALGLHPAYPIFGIDAHYTPEGSESFDTFKLGDWYVRPFRTQHDAADPVGFLIANASGHRILYATDTYYIRYKFEKLTHIIIECNYCRETLMRNILIGELSESRQKRLLHSHFSLENVLKFLKATDLTHCVKIILVHLSDANSDEKRMVEAVERQTGIETIAAEDGMDINFDLFPF